MVIDQLGVMQTQQFKNTNKAEEPSQKSVFTAHIDKLFANHNHVLTRILQNGLKIPDHLMQRVQREAPALKRLYFGLDNFLIDPQLLPKDPSQYIIIGTDTMPIIIPQIFLKEGSSSDHIAAQKIVINLVDEKNWTDLDTNNMVFSDFLRAGLLFFSPRDHVRREAIKMVQLSSTPFLPQRSILFSIKCNLYTLLLFSYHHQEYFPSLQAGITAYLKFIKDPQ
jgi:hypothetical protein